MLLEAQKTEWVNIVENECLLINFPSENKPPSLPLHFSRGRAKEFRHIFQFCLEFTTSNNKLDSMKQEEYYDMLNNYITF